MWWGESKPETGSVKPYSARPLPAFPRSPFHASRSPEKHLDRIRHPLDLFVRKLRINRQAENFARGFFGDGKISGFVAERGVALLQMERQRIMQRAADAVGFEMFLQLIATRMTHGVD